MSHNSIFQDISNGFDFYHKLYELNLSEIFLKEYIILETIKDKIPKKSNDKESLIKNWFEKFDNKITKELMDFPINELLNKEDFYNLLIRKSLWIDWCIKEFSNEILIELLSSPNIASKKPVFIQYDHQVQTNTIASPEDADCAIIRIKDTNIGIGISIDDSC